jgi:carbon storage regulator CsrA
MSPPWFLFADDRRGPFPSRIRKQQERTVLILSRKAGETIVLGDNITITINRVASNRVSLGIAAPADVRITHGELKPLPPRPAAE